ncbi:MAG: hypothetical protein IPJ56_01435 [Gemmatimonadetes bacterium]|nr:hypothetical protein [Gemmatimonadota bacterium]
MLDKQAIIAHRQHRLSPRHVRMNDSNLRVVCAPQQDPSLIGTHHDRVARIQASETNEIDRIRFRDRH